MLVFSQIGRKGNLGNQLFQIASTIGIAKKNNHDFLFPNWEYSQFFENEIPTKNLNDDYTFLHIEKFEYHDIQIGKGNFDLYGWLQTEKYFDVLAVKHYFTFKGEKKQKVAEEYKNLFVRNTILISVRRGDFVKNPKFYQLTYKYYFLALQRHFPNWKYSNLIFISDDIKYCKRHFKSLKNAIFIDNLSPIEQIILASNCDHYIISNSTFSWWAAWLGENKNTKIICPIRNFSKNYTLENDKDYYPERWLNFDYENLKVPIKYYKILFIGELFEFWTSFKYEAKKIKLIRNIVTYFKRNPKFN